MSLATIAIATGLSCASGASAQDCTSTSVGFLPLSDLGTGLYLGQYEGGLYPGGSNTPPPAHDAAGRARAAALTPLDVNGDPDPEGRSILLSVGMSNTTAEYLVFQMQAMAHPIVEKGNLAIVQGAKSGEAAGAWDSPTDANYDRVRDQVLAVLGFTEAQVQVVWVKQANPRPLVSLPDPGADAFVLRTQLGNTVRALQTRYPNLEMVFFSSRIYAGYATVTLNPEPYAYESGFSVKWLIEAQIQQEATGVVDLGAGDLSLAGGAPWLGWGAYLWADGLTPRNDGLTWQCADLMPDGTHPSSQGRVKVSNELLDFFLTSPYSIDWFREFPMADVNLDGVVGIVDFLAVLAGWGPCGTPCDADVDRDGIVDFLSVLMNWSG